MWLCSSAWVKTLSELARNVNLEMLSWLKFYVRNIRRNSSPQFAHKGNASTASPCHLATCTSHPRDFHYNYVPVQKTMTLLLTTLILQLNAIILCCLKNNNNVSMMSPLSLWLYQCYTNLYQNTLSVTFQICLKYWFGVLFVHNLR